jgi:predicted  nucleic acid-binding Zn-ribbon protein
LRDFSRKIQEEIWYWRQREDELEKEISKCQDSFTSMREELDKSRFQLLQLGEKFIELDNWQEERFIEVTAHL